MTSAGVAFLVALTAGAPVIILLRRIRLIDTPNGRSSHSRPTPRGGGLAIMGGATAAALLAPSFGGPARIGLLMAALGFGVIGLVDDLHGIEAVSRIWLQVCAGALSLPWLLQGLSGHLVWQVVFALGCLLWLVAYTNAFNFMDGINGISVAQAVVAGGTWVLIGVGRDLPVLVGGGALVAAAALGFLPFNFPKAAVFLGDVGSYFLGAWLAALAIVGVRAGVAPEAVLAPLALYLVDTGTTIVQRARAGADLFTAHRQHTYQRLTQLGWSHTATTTAVTVLLLASSALGSLSLTGSFAVRVLADAVLAAVLIAYMNGPRLLVVKPDARQRAIVHAGVDSAAWVSALMLAMLVRYDFHVSRISGTELVVVLPLAVMGQIAAGVWSGLYTGRWRLGSFEEVSAVARAAAVTTALLTLATVLAALERVPPGVTFVAGVMTFVLMGGTRYAWRLALENRRRPAGDACQRLVVFGAGEAGAQVVASMLIDSSSPYLPVALLDDDPAKRNLSIKGVRVVGDRHRLAQAAAEQSADTLLIAMPSANAPLVTELSELAREAGLQVKVLPAVSELFSDQVGLADIRDITPADLLGRHEIDTDVAAIAGYLTNKRVLVSGAGGSIGSELCRQIYSFSPAQLIMVDRDESALHAVQLSLDGRPQLDSPNLVLLDLRDRAAVAQLLEDRRPEVVFHAAALKHLSMLERHPAEAVKTNIWGTRDLLELAAAHGVERFVNISTDKAADPSSVLGYTKRITERLTTHFAHRAEGTFLSVRFGNVLGSRGSVLTTFEAQIERGGPITVTHPDVTRFFMTIEEAVQLVVQAGAIGRPGEVLVLDMGAPVSIAELARLLAARSQRPIEIEFTSLRPGEKLHEVLLGAREVDARPIHPLISHVDVPPLAPDSARRALCTGAEKLTEALRQLCTMPAEDASDLTNSALQL